MLLNEEKNSNLYFIRSYQPGRIMINDIPYSNSLILTRDRLLEPWRPHNIEQLQSSDLDVIVAEQPEVVLLGTGAKQHFPSAAVLAPLIMHNIGFEVMDTAAACRSYNLLAADGRKVLAALLIT